MSQASNPFETMQGYSPPTVTQFSVFLDNKVGKLLELVESFEHAPGAEICALSVHDASDHAVVRLITSSAFDSKQLLRKRGLAFSEMEVLVVELREGHSLGSLCLHLLGAELNIHFAYPLMLRAGGQPTIALAADDLTLAGQILRKKGYALLGECDLPSC